VKIAKLFLCASVLTGGLAADGVAMESDGVVLRERLAGTNYCRLRFPAIREDTLGTAYPTLKSPDSGDLIDFYGPCDENPVGPRQVLSQLQARQRIRRMERGN